MSAEIPPFFLVWCEGGGHPRYQHQTAEAASKEAERLARDNPGDRFFVLVPMESVRRSVVDRQVCAVDVDMVPF